MSDMALAYERHRVGIDEYHRMVRAGVFDPDARLELINGEIVERMTPIHPPHATATRKIASRLTLQLGDRASVGCQLPATLPDDSEPQPDVLVARPDTKCDWISHPGPADILLIVEVADSSLAQDRKIKVPLYAGAGIIELWLVDLVTFCITIYRDPVEGSYASVCVAQRGDPISPLAFPDESFAVSDFLPPP